MPIYEYQCDDCGHMFELMKKRSDPEPNKCPECGAESPRRAISRTGFQLKGSGWYVTDYKTGTSSSGASTNSDSGSASESSDDSSSSSESSSSSDSADPAPAKQEVA